MNLLHSIELLEDSLNNTECEFLKQEIQETQRDQQAVKARNAEVIAIIQKEQGTLINTENRALIDKYFQMSSNIPEAIKSFHNHSDEIEGVLKLFDQQEAIDKAIHDDLITFEKTYKLNQKLQEILQVVQDEAIFTVKPGYDIDVAHDAFKKLEETLQLCHSFASESQVMTPVETLFRFKIDSLQEAIGAHAEELLQTTISVRDHQIRFNKKGIAEYIRESRIDTSIALLFDHIIKKIRQKLGARGNRKLSKIDFDSNQTEFILTIADIVVDKVDAGPLISQFVENWEEIDRVAGFFEENKNQLKFPYSPDKLIETFREELGVSVSSDFEKFVCERYEEINTESVIKALKAQKNDAGAQKAKLLDSMLKYFYNFDIMIPLQQTNPQLKELKTYFESNIADIINKSAIDNQFPSKLTKEIDKITATIKLIKIDHDSSIVQKLLEKEVIKIKLIFFFTMKIYNQLLKTNMPILNTLNAIIMMLQSCLADILTTISRREEADIFEKLTSETKELYLLLTQLEHELWVKISKLSKFL